VHGLPTITGSGIAECTTFGKYSSGTVWDSHPVPFFIHTSRKKDMQNKAVAKVILFPL
jgi:hypothetical protein